MCTSLYMGSFMVIDTSKTEIILPFMIEIIIKIVALTEHGVSPEAVANTPCSLVLYYPCMGF
jgi:hypothetical protein